jgi:hypothetical protein
VDLRRVRIWDLLTGLAGVVLLVSLFLPWYSAGGQSATGWESFTVIDVILALAALSGIALVVVTAAQRTAAVPQAVASSISPILLVAAVLAVIRLLNLPGDADTRDAGVWIGTLAALSLFAFDVKSLRDKSFPAAMRPNLTIETVPAPAPDGTRRDVQ